MGKNDDAIANLKILLSKEPLNAIVLYELGFIYYNSGQYQEALDTFHQFKKTGEYAPDIDEALGKLEKMQLDAPK
jgi:tetratricopeptide (TPR) repeat protein